MLRSLQPEVDGHLQRPLALVFYAWAFGAVWAGLVSGAALTRYCKLAELPEFGFGLLTTLGSGAALIQLATSIYLERYGRHKKLFLVAGVIHRALWLPIGLIPWFLPNAWWWPALLMLKLVVDMVCNAGVPAWYTWMAELVPRQIRGRFFSRRNQMGLIIQLGVTVAIGVILDWAMAHDNIVLIRTISTAFAAAAVCGVIDFLFFIKVPGPTSYKADPKVDVIQLIRQPLRNPNFRRFLGFTGTITFATAFIGPFLWLYVFDVLHKSNTMANVMLMLVPMSISMLSQPFWGRVIDRIGRKPVMVICGFVVLYGAVAWLLLSPDHWVLGYLVVQSTSIAWTGIDLANFNMLLSMSESKEGRHYGSAYSAISSTVVAVAGMLSGLFGGLVAQYFRDWHTVVLGKPLTYHAILFLASSSLRVFALPWLIGLKDTGTFTTRDSLKFMAEDLFQTVQQTVFLPVRLIRQIGQIAYKIREPEAKHGPTPTTRRHDAEPE